MKKAECEQMILHFSRIWAEEVKGYDMQNIAAESPSYYDFKRWAEENGHAKYFDFRATGGPDYHAELWFDRALKQLWRR